LVFIGFPESEKKRDSERIFNLKYH
jgi:hypothetical protein